MIRVKRGSKGFTLIELLIVIAIIGILAAIAIPAYTGYTKKTKVAEVVHAMGAVKNAIIAYYTEAGAPPGNLVDAASIGSTLGVTPNTRYATMALANCNAASAPFGCQIKSTFTSIITGDITLENTNLGDATVAWAWGGSADAAYRPK